MTRTKSYAHEMASSFCFLSLVLFISFVESKFVVEKSSISVLSPYDLRTKHDAAIANFGVPDYGGSLIGNLIVPQNGSNGCVHFDGDNKPFKSNSPRPSVLLLDRGDCYFALKVWNGQQAGAAAVLVSDTFEEPLITMDSPEESSSSSSNVYYIQKIGIPSALIQHSFGELLKDAIRKGEDVVVKIDWTESMPNPDQRVEYELWTNINDECGIRCDEQMSFIKSFKGHAQILEIDGICYPIQVAEEPNQWKKRPTSEASSSLNAGIWPELTKPPVTSLITASSPIGGKEGQEPLTNVSQALIENDTSPTRVIDTNFIHVTLQPSTDDGEIPPPLVNTNKHCEAQENDSMADLGPTSGEKSEKIILDIVNVCPSANKELNSPISGSAPGYEISRKQTDPLENLKQLECEGKNGASPPNPVGVNLRTASTEQQVADEPILPCNFTERGLSPERFQSEGEEKIKIKGKGKATLYDSEPILKAKTSQRRSGRAVVRRKIFDL